MQPEHQTILVVDDDVSNRSTVEKILQKEGYVVLLAADGAEALAIVRRESVALVVTDFKMPGMTGLDLLKAARTLQPDLEVILMTAYGTVEAAVEAMKEGAYDFISKPFKRVELLKAVQKALEKQALAAENRRLRAQLEQPSAHGIIGTSDALRGVLELVQQVAPSSANVLIEGESGTGKELVAQAIHELSLRRARRFVKVNCGALPEALLESELFGYEQGAFTDARSKKEGRFELANGGSLFLDEIGELSPSSQVKLLRVLQEGEFERLGGTKTIRVDVRLVTATNRDLEQEISARRFREDLYYRLNVIRIQLPPLRERTDDIPLLVSHFLRVYARKNERPVKELHPDALELLMGYRWPGNVRELENMMERAVVLSRGEQISIADLPPALRKGARASTRALSFPLGTPLREIELKVILETLKHTNGDKNLAAHLLGINPRTIYRKLEELEAEEAALKATASLPETTKP
ncbi:MAG: sigma-54-dependent transcriptional regulator [Myxococcota bacterium]